MNAIVTQVHVALCQHIIGQLISVATERLDVKMDLTDAQERLLQNTSVETYMKLIAAEPAMQLDSMLQMFDDGKLTVEDVFDDVKWLDAIAEYVASQPELIAKFEAFCAELLKPKAGEFNFEKQTVKIVTNEDYIRLRDIEGKMRRFSINAIGEFVGNHSLDTFKLHDIAITLAANLDLFADHPEDVIIPIDREHLNDCFADMKEDLQEKYGR